MSEGELLGLRGKRALVLGGGQGIGEGLGLLLARHGVRVGLVDRELARAGAVAAKAGGGARAFHADVLDDGALAAVIQEADKAFGGLDILACIVGMATFKPALELTAEDWDTDHRRCLRYVFLASQALAKASIRRGSSA